MIQTEEEAKKQVCCGPPTLGAALSAMTQIKVLDLLQSGKPDSIELNINNFCIASECMAWRWFDALKDDGTAERRGYCGLAGKP